jgi:hypothetical protein
MGVERTLFATALFTGAGFQVLFSSFMGAVVIFPPRSKKSSWIPMSLTFRMEDQISVTSDGIVHLKAEHVEALQVSAIPITSHDFH